MTHGSRMESLSPSGRTGTGIQDCTLMGRGSSGAWALESASSVGLGGDGDTGDTTGITTIFVLTTTATSPTAEFSQIANTSITRVDFTQPTDFMAEQLPDFTVETQEDSPAASMDSPREMPGLVCVQGASAALITEEPHTTSPPVEPQASAEDFMAVEDSAVEGSTAEAVVASMVAEAEVTGD